MPELRGYPHLIERFLPEKELLDLATEQDWLLSLMTNGTRGWRPRRFSSRPVQDVPSSHTMRAGAVASSVLSATGSWYRARNAPAQISSDPPARSSAAYRELVQGAHRFLASHGDPGVARRFLDCLGIPPRPS